MKYDYESGKKRIEEILNNNADIRDDVIPKEDKEFTYDNGVRSWIGSIFVDIVGSKKIITENSDKVVAKVLRSFISETIEILNSSDKVLQIGVRGDCVYGVFSCPSKPDVYEIADITFHINTLVGLLNKLFDKHNYPTIKVGIGMAIGKDLIIKAGRKGTGINDRVWIGEAVVDACVLADKANRNGNGAIGFNLDAYNNFIKQLEKIDGSECRNWFTEKIVNDKKVFFASIIKSEFNKWVKNL